MKALPASGPVAMALEKRRGRAFGIPCGGREADRSGNPAPRISPRTGPAEGQGQESRPVQVEAGTADGRRPAEAERVSGRVGEAVPRRAHNPEVAGSTPASSSKLGQRGAAEIPVPSTICQPAAHGPDTWRFADEAAGTQGRHHFDQPHKERARGAHSHDVTTAGTEVTLREPRRRNHSPVEVARYGAPHTAARQTPPTAKKRGEAPARARYGAEKGAAAAAPFSTELHRSPTPLSLSPNGHGLSALRTRGGPACWFAPALPAFFDAGGLGGGAPAGPGNLLGLVASALVLAIFGPVLWLVALEVVRSRRRRAELARVGRQR